MGGVSVFSDSIHINLQNPAQLAGLKLTTFSIGGSTNNTKLNTETQNEKSRRTNLDYLAVGIPAGKFGFAFGLMPYSSVGYKILNLTSATNPFITQYNGIGGINKVFLGFGYKINKNLSLGVDAQYNFGSIETKSFRYLTTIESGTLEVNNSRIQGVNFTTGLAYETKVSKKHTFFGSVVYAPQANLNLKNERRITVSDQVDNQPVQNLNFNLPSRFSIGSGFGEVRKWLVGAEVTFQSSSDLKNRFDDISGVVFENSKRYSVGGYFVPNFSSYNSFFKRVTYRGGLRYENTGMVIQNKSIEDFAVNLGLGLPLSGTFSNINIGFEYGKRGTVYNNLIEENYFNLSVGLSFSDRWFVKRRIN